MSSSISKIEPSNITQENVESHADIMPTERSNNKQASRGPNNYNNNQFKNGLATRNHKHHFSYQEIPISNVNNPFSMMKKVEEMNSSPLESFFNGNKHDNDIFND